MDDYGARWTDEKIAELEKRIVALFEEAHGEVYDKYMEFVSRFEAADKKYSKQLEEGKITYATYRDWLRGQVFQRKRWQAQLADLARTLTRTKQIAMDIVNEAAPGVFAMNANWAAFEIEHAGNVNMGFGLYDEDTVKRLLRDEPELLPPSRVAIPKDEKWNMQAITRQINMGIVTGARLDDIAKGLQRVAKMNANQARTHARTAMTGAQNAGRIEGYHRAQDMGIVLEKEWLATLDKRTRHAHAAMDGQHVPVDEPFDSELGAIMFPGDPNARPANVYNCRCTLVSRLIDFPSENEKRRPNMQELGDAQVQKPIRDMTYAEWAHWKKKTPLKNKTKHAIITEEWKNAGFRNEKAEKKHEKHLAEYGGIAFDEYVQIARELLGAPVPDDVDAFVNDAGYEYRYRRSTNDFVIGGDGYIVTLFKPKDGVEYWEKEKEREKV